MSLIVQIILTVQMLSALVMVGLILLQHGKGADMGAAFGGGAAGSLFGATGSANFMSRATAVLATVFFVCTLALAYLSNARPVSTGSGSVLDGPAVTSPASEIPSSSTTPIPAAAPAEVPATPTPGAGQIPTR